MANRANLINTYNSNPTLQSRYTLEQYLNLFGFGATTTPTPTPTPDPTPDPTPGIPNIINQNLGGGGDGGQIPTNPRSFVTYEREYAPGLNFAEFTSGVEGTPSFTQQYNKPPSFMEGILSIPGKIAEAYTDISPVFSYFKNKQAEKEKITQATIEKARREQEIQAQIAAEEAAARARLENPTIYRYNDPSQRAVDDPSGGNRADAFTGGGANVAAANYTSTGREGFGYGLASGGRVGLDSGGPTFSEEDFPFFLQNQGGRPKPSLDYYDKYQDSPDDEYPIITIPMGKMKKSKNKKKKEKKFADGGRVYLYNRLK